MVFQACIFDLFGTLIPNVRTDDYYDALRQTPHILGVDEELFLKEWRATSEKRGTGAHSSFVFSVELICAKLEIPVDAETAARSVAPFRRMLAASMTSKPESAEVLSVIQERGLPLGLISNCGPDTAQLFNRGPLASFFTELIFSAEVGTKKPDPEIYRMMVRRLGVAPEHCLYIGDGHERELAGAAGLGMTTVLVAYDGSECLIRDRDEAGDHTVRDLREVLTLL